VILLLSQIGGVVFFVILLHRLLHRFYVAAWDKNAEKLLRKGIK
jgi:hypothetical protein